MARRPGYTAHDLPRDAENFLEWLAAEFDAFDRNGDLRSLRVIFSRSDRRRLRVLLAWLKRNGHVGPEAFGPLQHG